MKDVSRANLGKSVPGCQTILDFAAAGDDGGDNLKQYKRVKLQSNHQRQPEYQHSLIYMPDCPSSAQLPGAKSTVSKL